MRPRPIQRLSPDLVNQIAAGEVVERPASVLKELIENALDAGARSIEVRLEDGGKRLIRVQDDGIGIPPAELPLAVASHATSKLAGLDDLFRIGTLGFRGEALASIGSVAELEIRSLAAPPRGDGRGAAIEVRGGVEGAVRPCACSPGTVIEVRNLFFNTPARLKFLAAAPQETRQATLVATRLALGAPGVGFRVLSEDRVVFECAPTGDPLVRIGDLFGHDLAADLLPVEAARGLVRLSGYAAPPHRTRGDASQELVTLRALVGDGAEEGLAPGPGPGASAGGGGGARAAAARPIRDKLVSAAIKEAYKGFLMTRRFAVAFLELALPADLVDVNVHPAKLEVRFRNGHEVFGLVVGALRDALGRAPTLPALAPSAPPGAAAGRGDGDAGALAPPLAPWRAGALAAPAAPLGEPRADPRAPYGAGRGEVWARADERAAHREPRFDAPPDLAAARALGVFAGAGAGAGAGALAPLAAPRTPGGPEPSGVAPAGSPASPGAARATDPAPAPAAALAAAPAAGPAPTLLPPPAAPPRALLLASGYLVVESADGFEVVDPHALHERILYERFKRRIADGVVESERLLIPVVFDLDPAERATLEEVAPRLAPLGLRVEPFGPRSAAVHAVPLILARRGGRSPDWAGLVGDLLRAAASGAAPARADLLDGLTATMACKAAVKLGERLHPEEVDALLRDRALAERSHLCPHGRPTALRFTARDLERQFKR